MNSPLPELSRRQLLAGGTAFSVGVVATALAWPDFSDPRTIVRETSELQPPSSQPTVIEDVTEPLEIIEPALKEDTCTHHLRQTRPEEKIYANYIHSLGLTYIAPFELLAAHRRCRKGVHNELPPEELWAQMGQTLRVADLLRQRLGKRLLRITSAYRSPAYNRVIPGSAKGSFHTKNCALDLIYDCSPRKVLREAKKMRAEGLFAGGLGKYSSFLHLDTRGYNATWSRS